MVSSHLGIDGSYVLQVKMVIPETSQEKLNLRREITFMYPRYLNILIPVAIYLKLPFPSLPERNCFRSFENFEVYGFEVMKRFFIQKEDL